MKEKIKEIQETVVTSDVWKSIFRHGYADTPRNRILMIASNVFLHLHPSKLRRHGLTLRYTWCAGGLTFFFFLVTVVTGVLSLIAGLILLFWPTISITVLVAVIGIWLIVYGVVMAMTAFSLRRAGSGPTGLASA